MPRLSLIVAYARNRTIGRDNQLPWRLPPDLAHFKRTTLGHPIIMGRRTWESLPRALPGRLNVVISRNPAYEAPGATVVDSLEQALAAVGEAGDVFVIGGEQLYRLALPLAQRVVATELGVDVEGDAVFPALPAGWVEAERLSQPEHDGLPYDFVTYLRQS
ncbi:MAG: dihydrofolate reductase [Pigmentiphaga sp.]